MRYSGTCKLLMLFLIYLVSHTVFANTIRPGDVLGIQVYGQSELSIEIPVSRDGTISYPYVGTVKVAGLTVDQVKGIIEQGLRRILKDPIVAVYIKEYAPVLVYVQGAINKAFDISRMTNITLTRLIALIGLENLDGIDFSNVRLIRSGRTQNYDLTSYVYFGVLTEDPQLIEGDIVYLAPLSFNSSVMVAGAISKVVPFVPGMTVRMLISQIEQLDPDKAILEDSILLIGGKTLKVNLQDIITGKIDYPLTPGSYLLIPLREKRTIYVTGLVVSPGMKDVLPGEQLTLGLALAKAGGIPAGEERYVEGIQIMFPTGNIVNFTASELNKMVNLKIEPGSIINVIRSPSFRVYVINDFGESKETTLQTEIQFDPDEPKTLGHLLTKLGVLQSNKLKWIQSVKVNGKEIKREDYPSYLLRDKDVVEIRRYPDFGVYLVGDLQIVGTAEKSELQINYTKGKIYFEPDEPKTLQHLFVKIGGLKTTELKWIQSITINGKPVELSKADQIILSNNDVVEVRKFPEFRVYLTGDFFDQTIVYFEPDEPKTLQQLFNKLGGLKTDHFKWVESIKVNDKPVEISKLSSYLLQDKDVVEIRKYPEFRVLVVSDFSNFPASVYFDPDEPKTLEYFFVKLGGLKADQLKWIESIRLNGQQVDLSKLSSYVLKDKDLVEIKKRSEFYVYVQGFVNAKGRITFDPEEKRTLRTLLLKVGLPDEDVENEGTVIINNETVVQVKEVLSGNKDIPLTLGDIVQVVYEPFVVSVVGPSAGTVRLTFKEPRTLSYLLKKIGITDPETLEKVILLRDAKTSEYDIKLLLFGNIEVSLRKFDTIIVKPILSNAVYLTGDVAAYVTFASGETITLQKVFSRVGLSDLRRIEKITIEGKEIPKESNVQIERGSIINVSLRRPVYVTAMGYIRNTGRVAFDYYETVDLRTLFAKLGGLIMNPEGYYSSDTVFVIRNGQVVEKISALEVYAGLKNFELKDGDFVYVTESLPKQVYVFGKGMPNGLVRFTVGEEFDLRTLIGKLGGIREGVSRNISIVDGEKVQTVTWSEYVNLKLSPNSIVLFDVDKENFVYIVDASGKPDMFYTDRPVTLYEVLTKVGLNKNYRRIEITSGTQKQTIQLKDISQARNYNVKPGDVIRVLDVPENFAYVLGEVNRPGIITLNENTTVLQAIIQAGYFTSKAVPSSVWLYKGGVNGKPVRVNLQAAVSGGNIDFNPVVEPGDIVFVPTDMFKTAIEWIPIINNLIQFYNNVSNLFK